MKEIPILYESTDQLMATLEIRGPARTVVLGLGGMGGTLLFAGIIHGLKKWTGQPGPKGWTRTALLGLGGFSGTLVTHAVIHTVKGGQGQALDRDFLDYMKSFAGDRYQDALAEAKRLEEATGIPMTVEALKPVHFGWVGYKLPVGSTFKSLKTNVRFYPVGIYSTDKDFTTLKWWRGAKVEYLYDWLVFFVPERKEKQATMTPQPIFKNSFTFEVVSTVAKAKVDAWILGYVVLPETLREMRVTR